MRILRVQFRKDKDRGGLINPAGREGGREEGGNVVAPPATSTPAIQARGRDEVEGPSQK